MTRYSHYKHKHSVKTDLNFKAFEWCVDRFGVCGLMNKLSLWDIDFEIDDNTNMRYNIYYFDSLELLTEFKLRWL